MRRLALIALLLTHCHPSSRIPLNLAIRPACPPLQSGPRRLALLVGIGRYYQLAQPGRRPWPVLHTDREIEDYGHVLVHSYGFNACDIHVLRDQQATLPPSDLPREPGAGILSAAARAQRDFVVVAAARPDQSAWERRDQGVFTRHWVDLLASADSSALMTYRAAVERLTIDLEDEGLDQMPQVEGAADQQIFSGRILPNSLLI